MRAARPPLPARERSARGKAEHELLPRDFLRKEDLAAAQNEIFAIFPPEQRGAQRDRAALGVAGACARGADRFAAQRKGAQGKGVPF